MLYSIQIYFDMTPNLRLYREYLIQLEFGCYVSSANLFSRRLIEKAQRVEAITRSLQSHGADATQTAEVEDMITAPEKIQLEQYRRKMAK